MKKLMTTAAVLIALIVPAMAGSRPACALIKHTSDGYVNIRDPSNLKNIVGKVYPGQPIVVDLIDND